MIEIRSLSSHAEFVHAVALQKEIWGFKDVDLLPVRLFVVASKIGGQTFGAFDGSRMVAFGLAIPGLKPRGGYYLHSHMLGVIPEYRNSGVGRMIKLKQREEALVRGIALVEWTFDPLEIKNAYFNIERLGAVVRRYVRNQYGNTTSALHGGLPTDRCTAEWWIGNPRVRTLLDEGKPVERLPVEARIPVPNGIAGIKQNEPKRALAIQREVGDRFVEYFDKGLAVTGFERTEESGVYLLGPWESK
jgi:predicted GNAT superfamily acetyltransferase